MPVVSQEFASHFVRHLSLSLANGGTLDDHEKQVRKAFVDAASALPQAERKANRAWTRAWTLGLIEARDMCRRRGDYVGEQQLHREDMRNRSGNWNEIKGQRQGVKVKHASVRDLL